MWNKKEIELKDIPAIAEQGMMLAKAGNPLVEQLRCVFQLKDDPIIYMLPLLEYIDNVPDKEFLFFSIYQQSPSNSAQ